MEKAKWIDPCRICKNEVHAHMDHLIKTKRANSIREAARLISEDLDGEITPQALRHLDRRSRLVQNGPLDKLKKSFEKPSESKGVLTLNELVESGQKFSTIYADPPWQYGNQATRSATDGEYSTMSYEKISSLPVAKLTSENAHLHLWATNGFIHEALHLIEAWGFGYKSCFVWIKTQMGIGNYWRVSHEFLLLGVKGSLTFADHSLISWAEAKRTRHSAKPEAVRQFIERASPPPYLELFGRRLVRGWTVFGNQIEVTPLGV